MASFCISCIGRALRTLSLALPNHTRRLVLWSTLYSKMYGDRAFTPEQGERLNKALALAKDGAALCLPARLGKFISSDLEGCFVEARKAVQGEQPADAVAFQFVRSIPSWLRYASEAFMVQDFRSAMAAHRLAAAA